MKKLPTDLEILNAIYNEYYDEFANFDKDKPTRISKVHVPINIDKIAARLGTDGDIIFGRLYYVLNKKYSYKQDDGADVRSCGQ